MRLRPSTQRNSQSASSSAEVRPLGPHAPTFLALVVQERRSVVPHVEAHPPHRYVACRARCRWPHGQALGCRAVPERSIAQNKYDIGAHSAVWAIGKWQRTRQDHHVLIVVRPRDGGVGLHDTIVERLLRNSERSRPSICKAWPVPSGQSPLPRQVTSEGQETYSSEKSP